MYSSPIDLPALGPKPQKSAPTQGEPDGRFSELLRGPSDTGADHSDSATAAHSKQAAQSDRPSDADAEPGLPADPVRPEAIDAAADAVAPDTAVPETVGPALPVIGSEAATRAQPQGGPVAEGVPAATPPSGIPLAQPPMSSGQVVTPSAAAAAPEKGAVPFAMPAATRPPFPATPAEIPGQAGPAAPATNGVVTAGPPTAPPAAAAQPAMATAAPAAAGKTAMRAGSPNESAAKPGSVVGKSADPAAPTDRPISTPPPASAPAPAAAPERLAAASAPAKSAVDVPLRNEPPDLPAQVSKAGADPGRVTLSPAMPKASAVAATPLTGNAPATTPATTVPSTTVETTDAALSVSQAEPAAASNPGPIGRMATSALSAPPSGHSAAAAQPAAEQVVLQVQRAVRDGVDRLTMQMKPASLGRVDIQMEVGFDGRLQAVISAERPETLHLLQRDARTLAEALNDAGLQTDSGSLSFNLRGHADDHAGGRDSGTSGGTAAAQPNSADDSGTATTEITLTLGDGRVDIKV